MKLLKTSTLLLCMTASGCSYFQTQDASSQPAKAPAEQASSHSWWPFGKDDGQTVAKQATEQKAEAEHVGSSHWWWPFGKDEGGQDVAAKAAEQKAEIAAAKKEVAAAAEPKAANPGGGRSAPARRARRRASRHWSSRRSPRSGWILMRKPCAKRSPVASSPSNAATTH